MANFTADPEQLRTSGNKMRENAHQLNELIKSVFNKVEEIVNNEYIDPASRQLANEIYSYDKDLAEFVKVLDRYGEFCFGAAKSVVNNQENIIDSIKGWIKRD